MYNFQTAILVEKGYDFNNVFANEQAQLTKLQGFQFNLPEVVGFLKSQSKNFTVENPMNIEVDKSIYSIVNSYHTQMGIANPFVDEVVIPAAPPEPAPMPEPEPIVVAAPVVESATVIALRMEISDLEGLIEMEDNKKTLAKLKKEIEDLKGLIEMESDGSMMAEGGAVDSKWAVTIPYGIRGEGDEANIFDLTTKYTVDAPTEDLAIDKAIVSFYSEFTDTYQYDERGLSVEKYAQGGGVDGNDRMYNFLKDDLEKLEKAVNEDDNEETDRFFSYWTGDDGHLKSLVPKEGSDKMYNFMKDDLEKLEKAVSENDKEEIDRFFSYWNIHLKSLKYANGGKTGGSKWSEIHSDHEDEDGTISIDAWTTGDDNESGKVIAKVDTSGNVTYLDEWAKTDSFAQEVINEVLESLKA